MSDKLTREQTALVLVEAALGENLVWLTDQLDQLVRQQDPDTLRRLKQLNDAWVASAQALEQSL